MQIRSEMKNCIIVDNNYKSIRITRKLITTRKDLKCVNAFQNPIQAIEYLKENKVDLVFLEISMDEMSGQDFLISAASHSLIIITTLNRSFALQAFQYDVVDYILKTELHFRIDRAIDKAIQILNCSYYNTKKEVPQKKDTLSIISNRKVYTINTKEIIYIESRLEYLCFNTKTNQQIISLGSLKAITNKLFETTFLRIHKSYIINTEEMICYNTRSVLMSNGTSLVIGKTYKDAFLSILKN